MSLNDWHQMFNSLNGPIQQYIKNPLQRPTPKHHQPVGDTNLQLNIAWMKMNASIYSKLFTDIDFDCVFPYVIKAMVTLQSNVDKFNSLDDVSVATGAVLAGANGDHLSIIDAEPNVKRTPKQNKNGAKSSSTPPPPPLPSSSPFQLPSNAVANGVTRKAIQIRECCVRLPLLKFDKHGQVIQQPVPLARTKKRKFSSIVDSNKKIHSIHVTPIRNGGKNREKQKPIPHDDSHEFKLKFKCSSSSTPFARHVIDAPENGDEDDETVKQKRRSSAKRATISTPRSSQERKIGSARFNPRIRLLKMPETGRKLNISNIKKSKLKIRDVEKKSTKTNGKSKKVTGATGKRVIKKKIRSIPNESQMFETPKQKQKQKKPTTETTEPAAPPTDANDDAVDAVTIAAAEAADVVTSPAAAENLATPENVSNDIETIHSSPCNDIVKTEDM